MSNKTDPAGINPLITTKFSLLGFQEISCIGPLYNSLSLRVFVSFFIFIEINYKIIKNLMILSICIDDDFHNKIFLFHRRNFMSKVTDFGRRETIMVLLLKNC